MNLLDEINEMRERLNAAGSLSSDQLRRELLTLSDVLESHLENMKLFSRQVAEDLTQLRWKLKELEQSSKNPPES